MKRFFEQLRTIFCKAKQSNNFYLPMTNRPLLTVRKKIEFEIILVRKTGLKKLSNNVSY